MSDHATDSDEGPGLLLSPVVWAGLIVGLLLWTALAWLLLS